MLATDSTTPPSVSRGKRFGEFFKTNEAALKPGRKVLVMLLVHDIERIDKGEDLGSSPPPPSENEEDGTVLLLLPTAL